MDRDHVRAFAAFAVLGTAACFADAPPVDDTSTTTGTETSAGATSVASTDETGDATSLDPSSTTNATSDSTSDGSDTGTTGAMGFCDEAPGKYPGLYTCLDFDADGGAIQPWMSAMGDGGALMIAPPPDGTAPSAPNVLWTELPVDQPYGLADVYFPIAETPMETRLRVRMELGGCTGRVLLARMQYGGAQPFVVTLQMGTSGLQLAVHDATGTDTAYDLDPAVLAEAGAWAEYEVRANLEEDWVRVFVNGTMAAEVDPVLAPDALVDPPTIRVGLVGDLNTPCAAWFDDIVVY